MSYYVYSLTCPIENKIKYIGVSNNPKRRLYSHMAEADMREFGFFEKLNYLKLDWFKFLRSKGSKPILKIISQYINRKDAVSHELHLINSMNGLLNIREDA